MKSSQHHLFNTSGDDRSGVLTQFDNTPRLPASVSPFAVGTLVESFGLKSGAEEILNHHDGQIQHYITDRRRYEDLINSADKVYGMKPGNIKLAASEQMRFDTCSVIV